MLSNYEKVYKIILPRLRERAARMMANERGRTQEDIARLLGVTQAAVSKYLNGNPDLKGNGIVIKGDKLNEMVKSITDGREKEAQKRMCSICQDNVKFECRLIVK